MKAHQPKKRSQRRRSPTIALESDKRPRFEAGMVRVHGRVTQRGRLSWVNIRTPGVRLSDGGVDVNWPKLNRLSRGRQYTFLHTHPVEDATNRPSLHSDEDIVLLLSKRRAKTSVVAQRDDVGGKVGGHMFIRKTGLTPRIPEQPTDVRSRTYRQRYERWLRHPVVKELLRDVEKTDYIKQDRNHSFSYLRFRRPADVEQRYSTFMKKYGLQFRPVVAPGFTYRPGRGFVKQKPKP